MKQWKLQYTPEQVCKIKIEDFAKNNPKEMLHMACNHSVLSQLEMAYPKRYYREGIKRIHYRS